MRTFTFNGTSSNGIFKTNAIRRQMLAPIESEIKTIRGKGGGIALKSFLGVREIEIDVTLLRTNNTDLRSYVENTVVPWLYTDIEKNLIFTDEPERIYKAKLISDTEIEDFLGMGEVTLKFICADPFKYRDWEKTFFAGTAITNAGVFTVLNEGTAPVYPKIRIVPTVAVTWIKLTNQTTGKMMLLHNTQGALDAWDTIIVDCNLNRIYDEANGTRRDYILDLTSDYFPLVKGNNNLIFEANVTPNNVSARVIYTERYY
jgi:predicted phage tail component-like protein